MGNENVILEAKKLLAQLGSFPQYAAYVREHKLKLIDSRLAEIDDLLDRGLL